jgi:hypothetical protein
MSRWIFNTMINPSIKAKILDSNVALYESPSRGARVVCQITDSPEVELGKAADGFVEVELADGSGGFIDGKVRIFRVKKLELRQDATALYGEPNPDGPVVATLAKGARIQTNNPAFDQNGVRWLQVTTDKGVSGFIRGNSRVTVLTKTNKPPSSKQAYNNIVLGGGILLLGVVVTVGSYSAVSRNGGPYLVAWGAILFGGIRLIRGLFQMTSAS